MPALTMFLVILALGIIDAAWGAIALMTFLVSVLAGAGIHDRGEGLLFVGLGSVWVAIPVIIGKVRPFRREHSADLHDRWVRAGDFVVAPLAAFWLAGALCHLIPEFAGTEFPVFHEHMKDIQLAAGAAMLVRVTLEFVAAGWYPRRMQQTAPESLPSQEVAYALPSVFVRSAIFVFLAWGLIGNCWQLWAAVGIHTSAELVKLYKGNLPKYKWLFPLVPRDFVKLLVIVVFSLVMAEELPTIFSEEHDLLKWGLLFAVLAPSAFHCAEAFVDRSVKQQESWPVRFAGVAVVFAFAWLAVVPVFNSHAVEHASPEASPHGGEAAAPLHGGAEEEGAALPAGNVTHDEHSAPAAHAAPAGHSGSSAELGAPVG